MINLRGKQPQAVEKLRAGIKAGKKRQVLYFPTGGGKTEMAMYLMKSAADKGNKSAMLMDRRVLVNQTSARMAKYGIDHGVYMAGNPQTDAHIQIVSEQTLASRGGLDDVKLMILDECHNLKKSTIDLLDSNPNIFAIGLSASPFTDGLADIYHDVVSVVTTHELVEEKLLAPLKIFVAKEIDMTGAKKSYGEWSESETESRAMQITGDIVAEWQSKTKEIFGKPVKTIVFSAGVKHGQDLAEQFKQAGFNFVSISYLDKEAEKERIIAEFNKPDSEIIGLVATDILTKGFDCPDVKIGISARPFSKSFSSHVQQLGRVMRSAPGKDFGLWICHSGNFLRFYDEWVDLYYNGVSSLKSKDTAKKEKTEEEKKEKICPECQSVLLDDKNHCNVCGWDRPITELEQVAGKTEEATISADDAPLKIDDKTTRYKVKSIITKPHKSKSGSDGHVVIINGKYRKYFHTEIGLKLFKKLKAVRPTHIEVNVSGMWPEIKLIWNLKNEPSKHP